VRKYITIALIFLSLPVFSRATDISIIPKPVSLTRSDGQFVLTPDTRIVVDDSSRQLGIELADMLAPATGFKLAVDTADRLGNVIRLKLAFHDPAEAYGLEVSPDSVTIRASGAAGIFYGMQTLRQLLPPEIFSAAKVEGVAWNIRCVRIEDHPRLEWRGMMLDCSRHFMPKEFVERFIDLLAMHKMNSFHWHLTDDQGWRIEIKKYPKLTTVGAWRKETLVGHAAAKPEKFDGQPYGGFYTQDDIREVVQYAADRYVNVMPEIEMPGHSAAAIAAYPELGCVREPVEVWTKWGVNPNILNPSENTIHFYQDVLSEVLDLFPSKFVHLGGDEVPLDQWNDNPAIMARMKELGLADEPALQRYMLRRMEQFLGSKGRRLVGWDEILDADLPADAVVMSWHGVKEGVAAAASGHDVVMTPIGTTYFDHYQSHDVTVEPLAIGGYLPLRKVFEFDPVPRDLPADPLAHILGSQGQIWTEYIPTPARVEYMAYPRACALAEDVWSPAETKDYADFTNRLTVHLQRLKLMKVNYRTPRAGD
jgi:hexosaminidase